MARLGTLTLSGASGTKYTFEVYSFDTKFKPLAAVYYISRREILPDRGARHTSIYVGQTGNLSERFDGHHDDACFSRNNANCKSVLLETSLERRLIIESDLVKALNPPCNG